MLPGNYFFIVARFVVRIFIGPHSNRYHRLLKGVILFFFFAPQTLIAQHKPFGIYTFNKQEMSAQFYFTDDNHFEFVYAYGAVDRTSSGTFSMSEDTVKLHATKEPGKDFKVTKQSKKDKGYTIVAKAPNPYLQKHILALVIENGKEKYFESDENGIITISVSSCEKIYLQYTLFPDVFSLIKDESNDNNWFEVELQPSLAEVSFKGIDLILKGDELICPSNYFLQMENIRFVKE